MGKLTLKDKLKKLEDFLLQMPSVAVAFSGGVDSTFLLYYATKVLGEKVIGIYFDSKLIQRRERDAIRQLAANIGAQLVVLQGVDLSKPVFVENSANRCYYCKGLIFDKILSYCNKNNITHVADGSNADDAGDYRPGKKALMERNVRSPLQEAQLTKDEIRLLSREYNLPTWDKDALACLATRIPHGTTITAEKLQLVDSLEEMLVLKGFRDVRARLFNDYIKLEVRADQVPALKHLWERGALEQELADICSFKVVIDPEGYKMGNLSVGAIGN